jgi:hypothetical protein
MKTIQTATILIAMVAMISMTGFAAAGSTTQIWTGDGTYTTSFGGTGTGDLTIFTYTSYGDDRMSVDWQNTNVGGNQWMNTGSKTGITRDVTVGTSGWQQAASGNIVTGTNSMDTGNGHYIGTLSTYADDVAYGSNVRLQQTVKMCDNGPDEVLRGETEISGFAYGGNTLVTGYVEAGAGTMFVSAGVGMDEGSFNMDMKTVSRDNPVSYLDRTRLKNIQIGANGEGSAELVGSGDDVRVGLHTTNDGHWDNFAGSQGTDFFQHDAFDTNYDATGYIYAIELP